MHPSQVEKSAIEKLIGEHVREVASELRLIDVGELVAFIQKEQTGNLRNLVQSSTELHFKPGTLRLAERGEVNLGWGASPVVTFPLIFTGKGAKLAFRLQLRDRTAGIVLQALALDRPTETLGEVLAVLRSALQIARTKKRDPAS